MLKNKQGISKDNNATFTGGSIEHEYQFPDINKKNIIKKIKELGGKQVHPMILYNSVYYWNYKKNYFYRIRNENNNITLTKKVFRDKLMPLEYEINIIKGSSFKEIEDFVKSIIKIKKFGKIEVEKFREKWSIDGLCHEIVFDIWPGLPEYMEVDCATKRELDEIIPKLGLKGKKYYTTGVFEYYHDVYGLTNRHVFKNSNMKFNTIAKILEPHVKKNKEYLHDMQKNHKVIIKKYKSKV